ncbi:hypothetical protein LTR62_004230 [Meristemomyces frigidus]|uniref:DNA mismatch repair protein S5 domain-containing protein n=1 Tax=Meristemomyces frigidus TaxID=1508187 RepID=A0AAN7TEW2_9PEZI|nr:hypothetical protein LTR62_004230 [Meristemomyces frigidus]
MSIQKLANNTIRLIGASQILNEPSALVKELIDNALDAKATSIAIEISTNTLDVVQVRDNGHGIAPEDRAMAAVPNSTSKLTGFDDLRMIGGSTLGFRGQALAAAAELSGSMIVSTRVEGEEVATSMTINQLGDAIDQQRASLPIGTTVRVTDFIKSQPVRRQQALKNTEKTLKHLKQSLQAYAFARPHVRLSLRVLKAKNDKGNWMYAPKPGASVEDAAIKIVGSACVTQCTWIVLEECGFELRALVPRPDAEVSKVANLSSFVSIDARPVSNTRGTVKQVTKIFREALKAVGSRWNGVKDPFVNLLISCPSGSYDPNVEPSKDDVLFEDPETVITLARKLFSTVYTPAEIPVVEGLRADTIMQPPRATSSRPPPQSYGETTTDENLPSLEDAPRIFDGSVLSAPPESRNAVKGLLFESSEGMNVRRIYRPNMYGCDEEDLDLINDARSLTGWTEAEYEELRQARKDITVSNPWVTAKMNAIRSRATDEDGGVHQDIDGNALPLPIATDIVMPPPRDGHANHLMSDTGLPTPRPSSPSPPVAAFHPSDHVPDWRIARDGRVISVRGPALAPFPDQDRNRIPITKDNIVTPLSNAAPERPAYNYGTMAPASSPGQGTPLNAIPYKAQRPLKGANKLTSSSPTKRPFVSPVTNQTSRDKVWFDRLENDGRPKQRSAKRQSLHDVSGLVQQGELGDLMDEPRRLTPPSHNQDIRDWIGSIGTGGDEAASMIERRNYGRVQRSGSVSEMPSQQDENVAPPESFHRKRGFMPASEFALMEAQAEELDTDTMHPPKRRRTRPRPLQELSTNAPTRTEPDDDEDDVQIQLTTNEEVAQPVSKPRSSTTAGANSKLQRTKSSRLPLERIPKGKNMHTLELRPSISLRQISCLARQLDGEVSLLRWNEPALEVRPVLESLSGPPAVEEIAERLRMLLIERVSDGEMVLDLGGLVHEALAVNRS